MRRTKENIYPHVADFDENVNDLFDVADFSQLKFDYKGMVKADPDTRVVVNQRDGHYCKTAGPKYHILQHRDIFHLTNAMMQACGLDAVVTVEPQNGGDTARVKYLFRDIIADASVKKPIVHGPTADRLKLDDGLEGVRLGVKFKNSYDSSTAFRGSGYFLRVVCTNGMLMTRLVPEMAIKEIHTHDILSTVGPKLEWFLRGVFDRAANVEHAMKMARERRVKFIDGDQRKATITDYVGVAKHGDKIDANIQTYAADPLNPTYFEIYDAFTRYTTHGGLTQNVQERMESISEMFLMPRTTVMPLVMAKA